MRGLLGEVCRVARRSGDHPHHQPGDRRRVRTAEVCRRYAAGCFIIYAFVALLSLSSDVLVHYIGWMWVNIGAVPPLFLASLVMLWYPAQPRPDATG